MFTMISTGFSIAAFMIAWRYRREMLEWKQKAAKFQDRAAKLAGERESLDTELRAVRSGRDRTMRQLSAMEQNYQRALKEREEKESLCAALREQLAELRRTVDEERESWTELLDRERQKNVQLYDDLTSERDAYVRLKSKLEAAESELSAERENTEREIRNIMNYDGTANGQEKLNG